MIGIGSTSRPDAGASIDDLGSQHEVLVIVSFYGGFMEVTFQIPDELASSLTAVGDLPRRALEAFALEELRAGRITEVELRKMLG